MNEHSNRNVGNYITQKEKKGAICDLNMFSQYILKQSLVFFSMYVLFYRHTIIEVMLII